MKKTAIFLCASMLALPLASCGKDDRGDGLNHMYDVPLCGNPQSLDPQFANDPSSNTVIKNLYSGLVSMDQSGKISCCNAESYTVSPDNLVYTFKLRQDNYWFFDSNENDYIDDDECFPVVADDYVFAFQRILDPQMQSPYASDFSCIKNAGSIIKKEASPESAGVTALDEYTLEITLDYPSAEFLGMLTSSAAYPCNKEFFYSTKGRYGLDEDSVMSNGAFYVRQWFYDPYGVHNILYMRRNDKNISEQYPISPGYLSFTIQKSDSDIKQLFKNEEIDCFTTMNSSYSSKKYSVTSSKATTLGLIFNPDDRYFANQNLRRALALSIDRNDLDGRIGSDISIASGIIPPAVSLAGRSYRELASDSQFSSYNLEEAKKYLETAKQELNIGSVESIKILVNAETVNSGDLHILSQSWQETLGIYIGIEDVTADEFNRRIAEGDFSIALYPLKGDMNSGLSVIEQFEKREFLKESLGKDFSYTEKIRKCQTVADLVETYRSAEQDIISSFGFIPLFYKNSYLVANKDNEEIFFDPFSESVDFRLAKNYS